MNHFLAFLTFSLLFFQMQKGYASRNCSSKMMNVYFKIVYNRMYIFNSISPLKYTQHSRMMNAFIICNWFILRLLICNLVSSLILSHLYHIIHSLLLHKMNLLSPSFFFIPFFLSIYHYKT